VLHVLNEKRILHVTSRRRCYTSKSPKVSFSLENKKKYGITAMSVKPQPNTSLPSLGMTN